MMCPQIVERLAGRRRETRRHLLIGTCDMHVTWTKHVYITWHWGIVHVLCTCRCVINRPLLLPYSGKVSREKTFTKLRTWRFRRENFADSYYRPDTGCARTGCSRRKLSWTGPDPRKFSPSKVSHYTVWYHACIHLYSHVSMASNSQG